MVRIARLTESCLANFIPVGDIKISKSDVHESDLLQWEYSFTNVGFRDREKIVCYSPPLVGLLARSKRSYLAPQNAESIVVFILCEFAYNSGGILLTG